MPIFSKFGVFEREVRAYLEVVCDCMSDTLTKEINEWFYNEGIVAFQSAQAKNYREMEDKSIAASETKKRPTNISPEFMKKQKIIGFAAMEKPFLKKFPQTDEDTDTFKIEFKKFYEAAVNAHELFYVLQANVANELNTFLNLCDKLKINYTDNHKLNWLIKLYTLEKKELSVKDEIENQLTLIKEFSSKMKIFKPKQSALNKHSAFPTTSIASAISINDTESQNVARP